MKQRCYRENETGVVHFIRFHPVKAEVICALDGGKVCVFNGESHTTPFWQWSQTVLEAETSGHVSCIDWNVRLPIIL